MTQKQFLKHYNYILIKHAFTKNEHTICLNVIFQFSKDFVS